MRFYSNLKEALFETERDLIEMGINVWPKSMQNMDVSHDNSYQTKEIIGYGFRVTSAGIDEAIKAAAEFHRLPLDMVRRYCLTEHNDRMAVISTNPGNSYKIRPDVWEPFLNKQGKFDYTYSERLYNINYFVESTLRNDLASRQAVASIWRSLDIIDSGGRRRIPCSLSYQLLVRPENEKLTMHVIYTMRSCDIYTHFGFDAAMAIMYGTAMAEKLPAPIHKVCLTMNIGSLHAYRKDYEPRGVF